MPPEVISTLCQFCDSPLVDTQMGADAVDVVVPFVVGRQGASEAVASWLQQQWLAPEALRAAAQPASIRSIWVPMYAYDATTRSRWSARVGIDWQRTETYTTTDNGKTVTRTRTVTETEWFGLSGSHAASWTDHLVSASAGLSEAEANALEPYDLGVGQPFAPERVAGHSAERPTVARTDAEATAQAELQAQALRAITQDFLPGDRAKGVEVVSDVSVQAVRLVLVPVWMAVVPHGDTPLRLLVNGQTAEVVGQVPRDVRKVVALVVVALLGIAALVGALAGWGGVG